MALKPFLKRPSIRSTNAFGGRPGNGLVGQWFAIGLILLLQGCHSQRPAEEPTKTLQALATNIDTSSLWYPQGLGQIYRVDDIGKSGVPKLSGSQLEEVGKVRERVQPRFRQYLKFAFYWGGIAVFLSRTPTPPDYGAESYVLNRCKTTRDCPYACILEIKYPIKRVVVISPSGYSCVEPELWFFKNH